MRLLRLDYVDQSRWLRLSGWGVLAISVLALGLMISKVYSARNEAAMLQSRLHRQDIHKAAEVRQNATVPAEQMAEALKYANRVARQLNLPWDVLFEPLEKNDGSHVALLTIEPDAQRSVLRISGEAKDYQAMLQWLRTLRENPQLKEVYLLEHKLDEQNPDRPVRFSLEARWNA